MYHHGPTLRRVLRLSLPPHNTRPLMMLWGLGFFLAAALAYLLVLLGRAVDLVWHQNYKRQPVVAPVYILATMRSGTTFLHRLMCLDQRFTYIKLFHTVFPAVAWYRLWSALGSLDAAIGRPFQRIVGWIESRMFSGWEGIHSTGFNRAEEDEQYWVYMGLTPSVYMFYPFANQFPESLWVDRLPMDVRAQIADTYEDNIRRHIYAMGGKQLLAKNALKAGRINTLYERMPDMKIVHIVRHPYNTIPSMLSMYSAVWKAHSPNLPVDGELSQELTQMVVGYYRAMHDLAGRMPANQYVLVNYDDLIAEPARTVRRVYDTLELPWTSDFEAELSKACAASRQYKSSHEYSLEQYGLTRDLIYHELKDLFDHYGWDPGLEKAA